VSTVVPESGVSVRKGPSFAAEKTEIILFGWECVLINKRVSPTGNKMNWLRMKNGHGWVYDVDENGQNIMIPHSLRHINQLNRSPRQSDSPNKGNEIAYNTIIARLFHNDVHRKHTETRKTLKDCIVVKLSISCMYVLYLFSIFKLSYLSHSQMILVYPWAFEMKKRCA
jgi:hypothetical protein